MSFFSENETKIEAFFRHLPSEDEDSNVVLLKDYFNHISAEPDLYDQRAKLIIEWRGRKFLELVSRPASSESVLTALRFFGYVAHERHLRTGNFLVGTEDQLLDFFDEHNQRLSVEERQEISRTLRRLILEIARETYSAADQKRQAADKAIETETNKIREGLLRQIQHTEGAANKLSDKIENWEEYLDAHQDRLNDVKSTYNFVGLSKGFNDIETSKRAGRKWLLGFLIAMGLVTIAVPLIGIFIKLQFGLQLQWIGIFDGALEMAALLLPIEVICIYYFRILLKNYLSMSAQIVQLELRQALCAFIQSYVEYKKELGNDISIDKFEEMIFSGITMEPGQIPQTFDGLEKFAGAINALKAK
ncbi:hypothetical protein RYZ26_18035 [Terasakiella sp. A23]|uniref:hypothetical protein n=1 Tax=Terasakiella sp. FCG-A23 TaxID=3080561 RepID=UPI002953B383|nr:hypothetical protein [Terasakiella sp. A23]MDV7341515.1 hypothetical protein [Terasakiella sp. A23]